MASYLSARSSLTDRFQTTVPEPVRKALKLKKRDKIAFKILATGEVLLERADAEGDDPVLDTFLSFLAEDINRHPQRIRAIDRDLAQRIQGLVHDVEVDVDAELRENDDE